MRGFPVIFVHGLANAVCLQRHTHWNYQLFVFMFPILFLSGVGHVRYIHTLLEEPSSSRTAGERCANGFGNNGVIGVVSDKLCNYFVLLDRIYVDDGFTLYVWSCRACCHSRYVDDVLLDIWFALALARLHRWRSTFWSGDVCEKNKMTSNSLFVLPWRENSEILGW